MDFKFCYVFNYVNANVYCIILKPEDTNKFESDEDLLKYYGFNPDDCHWMFTDSNRIINIVEPLNT